MHPFRITYTPAATSAAGIASAVATVFNVVNIYALTASGAADKLGHIITFAGKAATDYSGRTVTVTGTDPDGNSQTDTFAGPNGIASVSSSKYFLTVTAVSMSGATSGADTFDIGWTAVAVGFTLPINWRQHNFQVSVAVVITGTISVTVQHTFDGLHGEYVTPVTGWTWWPHATLVTKVASADGNYASPITATRLSIVSVTNGATVGFFVDQGN